MSYITIIGFVAAIFSGMSFVPQAIKTIKTKHTKDLSWGMYWLSSTGFILWLVYGLFLNDLPLIIANIVAGSLSITILVMKIKYG